MADTVCSHVSLKAARSSRSTKDAGHCSGYQVPRRRGRDWFWTCVYLVCAIATGPVRAFVVPGPTWSVPAKPAPGRYEAWASSRPAVALGNFMQAVGQFAGRLANGTGHFAQELCGSDSPWSVKG